ncbi:hypothetical protein QR680_016702 [Steinernema hermaphroditum]|uniref:Uncharacterized protein n=1 Tax=Steinernema hermaphroditum TaxID=289476 RepID=A0AA39HE70_9BILA|nr:hypothetical protein QR680_016702 [Steinernema hermaphroditum]
MAFSQFSTLFDDLHSGNVYVMASAMIPLFFGRRCSGNALFHLCIEAVETGDELKADRKKVIEEAAHFVSSIYSKVERGLLDKSRADALFEKYASMGDKRGQGGENPEKEVRELWNWMEHCVLARDTEVALERMVDSAAKLSIGKVPATISKFKQGRVKKSKKRAGAEFVRVKPIVRG